MGRVYRGMVVRTNYGTGPYVVTDFIKGCNCPSFLDTLEFGKDAPQSRPHYHILCKKVGERGQFHLNGYDENLNSVWDNDRLIACDEETLFLTMCCG